jgi:type IV pilus assembly protein PilV
MTKRQQKGFGLLEPLIAIVILSFGILGLARFQLNMLAQAADSRSRLNATTLAEELLSQVRVDPANAGCYATNPPAGSCHFAGALATYKEWEAKSLSVMGSLAGVDKSQVGVKSELNTVSSQLTVTLTWTTKGEATQHQHVVTTDVRI